ncbi:hypothetical protein EVAR_69299_1 [Eumeta japonica]|uniref:Uncharacterized protein n=1 Tax=Eumeta variegata TaxID=151549 RepID=A0A4C1SD22_EUMVA|nr:hypothetical protein EVAR_69299_1 [Eumeta japonica]
MRWFSNQQEGQTHAPISKKKRHRLFTFTGGWSQGNPYERRSDVLRESHTTDFRSRSKIPISSKPAVRNFVPIKKVINIPYQWMEYIHTRECTGEDRSELEGAAPRKVFPLTHRAMRCSRIIKGLITYKAQDGAAYIRDMSALPAMQPAPYARLQRTAYYI